MRETIHAHSNSLQRIEALADQAIKSQSATAESMAELVTFLKTSKSAIGYARRWWPRIATFAIGVAVAKGWITAENGKSFLSIFGMG